MRRLLFDAAIAIAGGLAGAFICALVFAACTPDPGPHVHVPTPTVEYVP